MESADTNSQQKVSPQRANFEKLRAQLKGS